MTTTTAAEAEYHEIVKFSLIFFQLKCRFPPPPFHTLLLYGGGTSKIKCAFSAFRVLNNFHVITQRFTFLLFTSKDIGKGEMVA